MDVLVAVSRAGMKCDGWRTIVRIPNDSGKKWKRVCYDSLIWVLTWSSLRLTVKGIEYEATEGLIRLDDVC